MTTSCSIRLVRKTTFSASVRYFDARLDEKENKLRYGSRALKAGFGHNYAVEVAVSGPVDPMTGMIVNLQDLDRWLDELRQLLDHRHLNDCAEFAGQVPTLERIAEFCFDFILRRVQSHDSQRPGAPHLSLHRVRVYEGADLWADVTCA